MAAVAGTVGLSSRSRLFGARTRRSAAQVVAAVAAIGLAELILRADTSALPRELFPPPSEIAETGYHELARLAFWNEVWATVEASLIGLLAATVLAIPIGIAVGSSKWVWRSLRLLAEVLRPLPAVALLPLLVLLVGVNLELKVYVVTYAAFWPLLFQSLYGVHDVDAVAWDMARAYRLTRLRRFTRIVLPTALPYIATGLRISAIVALGTCVAVELIIGGAGGGGLGAAIHHAESGASFARMYVYVVATGVVGIVANVLLRRLEKWVLFWHPSQRAEMAL